MSKRKRKKKLKRPVFEEESQEDYMGGYSQVVNSPPTHIYSPQSNNWIVDGVILSSPLILATGLYFFPPSFLLKPVKPGEEKRELSTFRLASVVLGSVSVIYGGWYIFRYRK